MKALSSLRRGAQAAPKRLLRSPVIRNIRHNLEMALEAKKRGRLRRKGGKVWRVRRVSMVGCITMVSSRNNARSPED